MLTTFLLNTKIVLKKDILNKQLELANNFFQLNGLNLFSSEYLHLLSKNEHGNCQK